MKATGNLSLLAWALIAHFLYPKPGGKFTSLVLSLTRRFFQPRTLQVPQRITAAEGFDRVMPLPVETLLHLWKEDYSQIPAPV